MLVVYYVPCNNYLLFFRKFITMKNLFEKKKSNNPLFDI